MQETLLDYFVLILPFYEKNKKATRVKKIKSIIKNSALYI